MTKLISLSRRAPRQRRHTPPSEQPGATIEFMTGNRLSPLPEERVGLKIIDGLPPPGQEERWETENSRFIKHAWFNQVVLDISYREFQAARDQRIHSKSEPGWRKGAMVDISGEVPTLLIDREGFVIALIIPRYFRGYALATLTANTTTLMTQEKRAEMQKYAERHGPFQNEHWRTNDTDAWLASCGVNGDLHLVKAQHAIGHEVSNSFQPSNEWIVAKTGVAFADRCLYTNSMGCYSRKINDLIAKTHPKFSALLRSCHQPLQTHAAVKAISNVWHSDFLGAAILMNKQSGEHIDRRGVRRGWDVLVAAGDFTGGDLYLKDLNVRIPFLPGTLIAFDGTRQRHEVKPFEGPQRISLVFFVHNSVFVQLGINSLIPDLTVSLLEETAFRVEPARKSKKRKANQDAEEHS